MFKGMDWVKYAMFSFFNPKGKRVFDVIEINSKEDLKKIPCTIGSHVRYFEKKPNTNEKKTFKEMVIEDDNYQRKQNSLSHIFLGKTWEETEKEYTNVNV